MGAEIKYKSDAYSTVSLDKKNFNKEDKFDLSSFYIYNEKKRKKVVI